MWAAKRDRSRGSTHVNWLSCRISSRSSYARTGVILLFLPFLWHTTSIFSEHEYSGCDTVERLTAKIDWLNVGIHTLVNRFTFMLVSLSLVNVTCCKDRLSLVHLFSPSA